jgi:hypothetical protein
MALHQSIQRLLLIGIPLEPAASPSQTSPPPRLTALIAAVAPAHQTFDERAVHFGHRYRSGFWSIYLLSALAVLCAILPLALGWDSSFHALHPYAGVWAVAEVCVIAVVSAIYYVGHKHDWQGEWLRTRTTAELTWYLPLIAPLVDFSHGGLEPNWYLRVFDPGRNPIVADQVAKICALNEAVASQALAGAWGDAAFVTQYAQWTVDILAQQRHYHQRIASKQKALLHRVHSINIWLFGLTALGALTHLIVHTLWLSLITTFFPALGASLHGALAQSEAYRLRVTSERLVKELQDAIDRIRAALATEHGPPRTLAIKGSIEDALELILEEHQDWQMLVRPHHLPLA